MFVSATAASLVLMFGVGCAEHNRKLLDPAAPTSASTIGTSVTFVNPAHQAITDAGPEASSVAQASPIAPVNIDSEPTQSPVGMLFVPGGTFTMGTDLGGEEDEHPAHSAFLKGYWLDVTEVSVRDYMECVNAGACAMYRQDVAKSFRAGADSLFRHPGQPVSGISWEQAKRYCEYRGKRLPREAEWERAARGDDDRKYPWGNSAPDSTIHGCFGRHIGTPLGTTCEVGAYPAGAGPYGHLDLAGNVWEWTADFYDPLAYRRPSSERGEPGNCEQIQETQDWLRHENRQGFTGTNPIPTECERVLRGGAFNYPASGLRVTNRVHHPGSWRLLMAGVRCAKDTGLAKSR